METPHSPRRSKPAGPAAEDARVGLIGWLAALDAHARLVPPAALRPATVIVLDRAVANGFQVGFLETIGPFLAYPPAFWWFADVWGAAAAGPAGIALFAADPESAHGEPVEPWVVLVPSDWPQTLIEFAGLCRRWNQSLQLYPYATAYYTRLGRSEGARPLLSGAAELDLGRGVSLPFPASAAKEARWLETLLQSPWLDGTRAIPGSCRGCS
jgi:hypothetical protein